MERPNELALTVYRCTDGPGHEGAAKISSSYGPESLTGASQLSAFCWNVHDGRLPQDTLSDFQRERALKQLPGILDYAGYVVGLKRLFQS